MVEKPSSLRDPEESWRQARSRILQLENSTARMSSRWLAGNAGVVAAAALILVTALVLGTSVARMLDNTAKTERAQTILHEASDLQDSMTRASTAARAYVIAHDDGLLHDRTVNIHAVIKHLDSLRTLLASDPEGSALLAKTRQILERRVALYDQLIAGASPLPPVPGEAERLRLARINDSQIRALRERANESFVHYQHLVIGDMRLSMVLALITGIASPLFGFIGVHLLRRERESQQARELQRELIHVQRLAIMGETSAMLAHEINQPLTAAGNYISAARRFLDNDGTEKARAVMDSVEQQIKRAAAIVQKLRRFIEKRETERSAESPEVLVEDAITLLGTMDSTITLTTKIAPGLPDVFVDRVQVQQVLVNLMRNAIEAMQGSSRRDLVLSMAATGNTLIEVALIDSGPGLAPEVAQRLFQPFASTKVDGMGVGLSICQSIVAQHGGRIWTEPNPQGGTIFRFTLPVVAARVAA